MKSISMLDKLSFMGKFLLTCALFIWPFLPNAAGLANADPIEYNVFVDGQKVSYGNSNNPGGYSIQVYMDSEVNFQITLPSGVPESAAYIDNLIQKWTYEGPEEGDYAWQTVKAFNQLSFNWHVNDRTAAYRACLKVTIPGQALRFNLEMRAANRPPEAVVKVNGVPITPDTPSPIPIVIHQPFTPNNPANSITLDASQSTDQDSDNQGHLYYQWMNFVNAHGSHPGILVATTPIYTFTPVEPGDYEYGVIVLDGWPGGFDGKNVMIEVSGVTGPENNPPVVNAGLDQTVSPGVAMPLAGIVQDDGNPNPPGACTIVWSEVDGPGDAIFENPLFASTIATFPAAGTYVLRLAANDGEYYASDDVTITVQDSPPPPPPPENHPPVARARIMQQDREITGSQSMIFKPLRLESCGSDGSPSSDPDGDPLTYEWSLVSVDRSSLAGYEGIVERYPPHLTANQALPDGSQNATYLFDKGIELPGAYTFKLKVTDSKGASSEATVTLTVKAPNVTIKDIQVLQSLECNDKPINSEGVPIVYGKPLVIRVIPALDSNSDAAEDQNTERFKAIDPQLGSVNAKITITITDAAGNALTLANGQKELTLNSEPGGRTDLYLATIPGNHKETFLISQNGEIARGGPRTLINEALDHICYFRLKETGMNDAYLFGSTESAYVLDSSSGGIILNPDVVSSQGGVYRQQYYLPLLAPSEEPPAGSELKLVVKAELDPHSGNSDYGLLPEQDERHDTQDGHKVLSKEYTMVRLAKDKIKVLFQPIAVWSNFDLTGKEAGSGVKSDASGDYFTNFTGGSAQMKGELQYSEVAWLKYFLGVTPVTKADFTALPLKLSENNLISRPPNYLPWPTQRTGFILAKRARYWERLLKSKYPDYDLYVLLVREGTLKTPGLDAGGRVFPNDCKKIVFLSAYKSQFNALSWTTRFDWLEILTHEVGHLWAYNVRGYNNNIKRLHDTRWSSPLNEIGWNLIDWHCYGLPHLIMNFSAASDQLPFLYYLMQYVSPICTGPQIPWNTKYDYGFVLSHLQGGSFLNSLSLTNAFMSNPTLASSSVSSPTHSANVSGFIDTSTQTLTDVFPLDVQSVPEGYQFSDPEPGDYSIQVTGSLGAILYEKTFKLNTEFPDLPANEAANLGSFSLDAPFSLADTQKITVSYQGRIIKELLKPSAAPQIAPADIKIQSLSGQGQQYKLSWKVTKPDPGKELNFSLAYSPDGSSKWVLLSVGLNEADVRTANGEYEYSFNSADLPGSNNRAIIQISCDDGWNTVEAVSPQFSVSNKPPVAMILKPEKIVGFTPVYKPADTISLEGAMYDPDTLGGEGGQFTWKLATGRVLGSVAHLEIKGTDLDMGDNEIILTAADKDGDTAEDSIAVKIEDNVSPDVAITNIEITPQQISQNDDLTYPDVQVSASLSNIRTDATARARLIVDGAFIQEKDLVIVANTITPVSFTWRPASTGNKTLRVEITNVEPSDQDLSNNALTKEVTVLSSDHTPPITSISSIPSGWTNQPVTITLTTTDTGGSGVDKTYYSLNGATPTLVYTGPITISNEGIYTVKYYSKDKAGNKETEKTASKQVKIDKTAPKGSIIINNGAASTTSPKITLRLSAKDSRSGMARGAQMRFSIDGSHWSTPVAYTASRILTLSSVKGTKKAYVRFKDVAGNWSIAYSAKIILR